MKGFCLSFFFLSHQKHQGKALYEWLLEKSKEMGIAGGSVFRGIASFGHNKTLHEEHFYELGADVPLHVIFYLNEEECKKLITLIEKEKIKVFYSKSAAEFGELNS